MMQDRNKNPNWLAIAVIVAFALVALVALVMIVIIDSPRTTGPQLPWPQDADSATEEPPASPGEPTSADELSLQRIKAIEKARSWTQEQIDSGALGEDKSDLMLAAATIVAHESPDQSFWNEPFMIDIVRAEADHLEVVCAKYSESFSTVADWVIESAVATAGWSTQVPESMVLLHLRVESQTGDTTTWDAAIERVAQQLRDLAFD